MPNKVLHMVTFHENGRIETENFTSTPNLDFLQKRLKGLIEVIPFFDKYKVNEKWEDCVAYCNEEGKLKDLPFNENATRAWFDWLHTINPNAPVHDFIVGPVVVFYGDEDLIKGL